MHLGLKNFDEAGPAQLVSVLGPDNNSARLLAVKTRRWGHDCEVVVEGSLEGQKRISFPRGGPVPPPTGVRTGTSILPAYQGVPFRYLREKMMGNRYKNVF